MMNSNNEEHLDSGHDLLLTIVARGTAIVTEIYRLVELIPEPFLQKLYNLNSSSGVDSKQYLLDEIVSDFSYFKDADLFEARIEQNPILKQADELFCDTYSEILTRFYLTFESVHRYANDLNRFILDLEDDMIIGQTLDTLLLDTDNLQLLCEAYYQLGYMLLLVDINFSGDLRERLIISYYRYSSYRSSPSIGLEGTCNLMRDTHFRCDRQKCYKSGTPERPYQRPVGYPGRLFARAEVNQTVVNTLIAKLQIIDIYNQTMAVFPHPDHRSNALSRQSSILYVLLYFCPTILKTQRSRMREITDKFFCDNWVLDIFMGERVNLIEAWNPYKAARESLIQILDIESVRNLAKNVNARYNATLKQITEQYLVEGWLNEDTFLEHNSRLLNSIREANVLLKWILLHTSMKSYWQSSRLVNLLNTVVMSLCPNKRDLCVFLQNLAVLEKKVTHIYDKIIGLRDTRINENKVKAQETLEELISIFNDTKPMRWVQKGANKSLATILEGVRDRFMSIDFTSPKSRNSVIKTINQMESARSSYSDDKSLQVVQLFMDTKQSLVNVLRYFDLKPDFKVVLQQVGEFSYAWRLMNTYFTSHIQQTIKDDPISMFGFEAIIIKLASAFETQLLRIQQVESNADLISVSQYYSSKLVIYIRDVLQIIPSTILDLISSIISIQTNNTLGSMPSKIHLDSLKEYALPEQRYRMLELTRTISKYAKGIMRMPNTTIGLVQIDSKQMLEDGMRRELSKRMLSSIQSVLQFDEPSHRSGADGSLVQTAQNMILKLEALSAIISGYKRSLEGIQDFLSIYGLKMWQEELTFLVKSSHEQALTLILDCQADQLSDSASIDSRQTNLTSKQRTPHTATRAPESSFIRRVFNELLKITNPRQTIYDEQTSTWYEQKVPHQQVTDSKIFKFIQSSLGVSGLNSIDKLCSSSIMIEMQRLNSYIDESTSTTATTRGSTNYKNLQQNRSLLDAVQFVEELRFQSRSQSDGPTIELTSSGKQSLLKAFTVSLSKYAPFSERLVNHLMSIGQLQAIRMSISNVLSTNCRYEAKHLYGCLEALNSTLLATLKHGGGGRGGKRLSSSNQQKGAQSETNSGVDYGVDDVRKDESADFALGQYNLEDSQVVFELTNKLEYVGLSDPMSKIYTLALQKQHRQRRPRDDQSNNLVATLPELNLIFLLLIEQSSKFYFSRSINGFFPRLAKSFYESSSNIDGQPLFYGVITLLEHLQPDLADSGENLTHEPQDQQQPSTTSSSRPLASLLELMSYYVRIILGHPLDGASVKPQDLTLEVVNVILSVIELTRLARVTTTSQDGANLLATTHLPDYIVDTFQYTICHLSQSN